MGKKFDCAHENVLKYITYLEGADYYARAACNTLNQLQSEAAKRQIRMDQVKALLSKTKALEDLIAQSRENNNIGNQTELLRVREKIRDFCDHEELDENGICEQCGVKRFKTEVTRHQELSGRRDDLLSAVEEYRTDAALLKSTTVCDDEGNILCATCEKIVPRGIFRLDCDSD